MKTKRFRLLTVLLAVVMMFALSIQAYAATSKPVTQDGIIATLVTDKDSYKSGESVNATVKIENNSGQDVFAFTQITVPSSVKLAGANAFDAVLANGQVWTSAAGVLDGTAGTTATGDNMQAGLWTVVSILAIGGVVALLVYGKNRKTWISMMLCVVMIGGLMATAVPAQAADVNGDIHLSCTIQVDGKDAEVSAIVSYVIYDETEEAEEPVATEAPTSPPTEAPATPEATETPATPEATETPTQPPVEDEVPSENGYYVVWDDFTFSSINTWTEFSFSSWDVALPQGAPTKVSEGAAFTDDSEYAKAQALRAFNAIADDFTMEFTMKISASMEDTFIDLKNEDTTAIRFTVEDDKLLVGDEELCAAPVDALKTFKLHISPASSTFTISVDGNTVMDGDAAKEFTFKNSADAIDRLYIETGVEEMGQVVIGTVRVYVDYYVNEKFLDGANLAINDEWKVTGDAATIYKKGTQGPDKYNALLKDGASITRDVAYEQDGAWVEFQQLMEKNVGEFAMVLADEAGNEFKVATKDGKFGYYNGNDFVGLYDCLENMWYHVMLKQTDAGTELYLNHKLKVDKLPNVKFTKMTFAATGGEAMLDDIVVKDWIPLPDDYVPEPVAVEKEEGATLVGLQSCNLWVEGEHFGYDWLTDWPERKTILGFYDEISVESADWELKFKIEHGIDFELYCWYRPQDGAGEPIKMPRNSRALHEGYMNAEYSDQMKFAITWEAGSGGKDLDDFKENIVPYWIEQYFKDDRYLLINNKPFIGMHNFTKLKSYFGGSAEDVKDAMDYLRQACKAAGFDGAYISISNNNAGSAVEMAQASFDGQHAYNWGGSCSDINTQKSAMQSLQNTLATAGHDATGIVPVVSQGWWDEAWDRDAGGYCTVDDFQSLLTWVRDDFMPTLDENSIGSKMILIDNWNEYGEGHFVMPAKLAGFGYVDAIKTVFGDSKACDETVQHVEPTQAQLDRIQHMYIQDRHVVLVDRDKDNGNLEVIEGYNWTFEDEGDTEGWTVGSNAGKWIKELKDYAVKDGNFWGVTYTPDELSAKVTGGELESGATSDPSLMSPDNLDLNANEAIAIKVCIRGEGYVGKPAIYFTTTEDQTYTSGKMVDALYTEAANGYAEITFDMTSNNLWTGTIKQIRFDPIERDGEFWIDSIQILKRKPSGDAEIYLDGERIYTKNPIETEQDTYMFPVEELSTLADVYVIEPLEKDRLFIYTDTAFFEFPYEGDTKMRVDGKAVDSVGVVTINNMLYVPIVDIFENIGNVTGASGGEYPAYEIEVTEATGDALAKINIEKYVDASILKAYYFTPGIENWTYGGKDYTVNAPASNGAGAIEVTGNGSDAKMWSPEAAANHFNINAKKADHIRMAVKTNANTENPTLKITVYGDGMSSAYTYNITLKEEMLNSEGYYNVLLDLAEAKQVALKHASEIDRVCIWYYDSEAGGTQTFSMDSFEILDIVEDNTEDEEPVETKVLIEESPYAIYDWDFTESAGSWTPGNVTGMSHDSSNEALTITSNVANDGTTRMNVWSSKDVDGVIQNPVNVSTADATHVLVRVQTEEKISKMGLQIQYLGEDGKASVTVSYTDVPYETDVNGDLYALVDLSTATNWDTNQKIARLNIYPISTTMTAEDVGKVVNITSVEILDMNWYMQFESSYFANSADGWSRGGNTFLTETNTALDISHISSSTDYALRLWSLGATNNIPNDPYKYTADDVTHIRVRLKVVVPETLPDTMTPEEQENVKAITSETLSLSLQYSDGTYASAKKLAYEIGTEDYVTLTYDISDIYADDKTLGRIGLYFFNSGNELLCKAGASVMLDSVQFLKRTGGSDEGGNEGEGDEDSNILKAFYFTSDTQAWSVGTISLNWVADGNDDGMLKGDFNASGVNAFAGWKSPSKSLLQLDPSEVGTVIGTIKVADGVTPQEAKIVCYSDDHSTSKYTATANYVKVEDTDDLDTYTVTFDCTALAESFGAGEYLNSIRFLVRTSVSDSNSGAYYLDSVEILRKVAETPTETPTAAPTAAPTSTPTAAPTAAPTEAPTAAPTAAPTSTPTTAPTAAPTEAPTVLKEYHFTLNSEGWTNGGAKQLNDGKILNGAYGLNFKVGEDADNPANWTNGAFKSPNFDPVLTASEVGSIRLKLKTTATAPTKVKITCWEGTGYSGTNTSFTAAWGESVDGVYTVEFDCSTLSHSIGSMRIFPVAEYVDETTNGEYWLDSVEILNK